MVHRAVPRCQVPGTGSRRELLPRAGKVGVVLRWGSLLQLLLQSFVREWGKKFETRFSGRHSPKRRSSGRTTGYGTTAPTG